MLVCPAAHGTAPPAQPPHHTPRVSVASAFVCLILEATKGQAGACVCLGLCLCVANKSEVEISSSSFATELNRVLR